MATLADELLADLMEDGSDGEEGFDDILAGDADGDATISAGLSGAMDTDQDQDQDDEAMSEAAMLSAAAAGRSAVTEAEDEDEAKARVAKMHFGGISDVRSVAGLIKSLKPVLEVSRIHALVKPWFTSCEYSPDSRRTQKINHYQTLPPEKQTTNAGSVEDNPEYRLLVEANELSSRIDNEIILVHKFIRDHYSVRFPELESLVQNPLLYAKTVAIIGNGPMDNMDKMATSSDNVVGQSLKQVLDGPSLMVVRLEATKTAGREMTESELVTVQQACDMTLQLDNAKKILTDYVQSRMNLFAPNLTVLIGSETAAQLVNSAGGLTGLAKVPACNIAAMGSKKQTFGLATNTRVRRQGFLFHSALVQGIPPDLRNQAMRIISAKLVLAARVDRIHSSPDGSTGAQLKQDCEDRLEKLTAPPPNKGPRALPAPDDKPSRKRGGRRARKAKEQYAMTDLRKAQNRMAFGKEELEVGDGDETEGLGMIGQGAKDGQIRATKIDQRTKARLSKKNAGWAAGGAATAGGLASSLRGFGQGGGASVVQGLRAAGVGGGGGGGTGTASVIAFTPFQGLELVNPKVKAEMERKRNAEEDRWFKSGTFTQVGGGAAVPPPDVKVDSAGFKVPALPALKRLKTEK
jgi:U4/U6 small nuclear ribonucleoprotein PRP31